MHMPGASPELCIEGPIVDVLSPGFETGSRHLSSPTNKRVLISYRQVGEVGKAIDKHVHYPAPCPQLHRLCASEEILRKLRECDKEILAGILNQDELKPLPTVTDGLCERAGRSGKRIVIEGEHCPRKPEGDDDSNNVPRTKVFGKSDPQSGPDNQNGGPTQRSRGPEPRPDRSGWWGQAGASSRASSWS